MENYNEIKINFEKFITTFKTDVNDLEFRKNPLQILLAKVFPYLGMKIGNILH